MYSIYRHYGNKRLQKAQGTVAMRWASWGSRGYVLAESDTSLSLCYAVSQGEEKQEAGNDSLQREREGAGADYHPKRWRDGGRRRQETKQTDNTFIRLCSCTARSVSHLWG